MEIRPQEGKQEKFLESSSDIVLYGGAAGGGKTYGLLLEAVRNITVKGFGAVILRKSLTQIAKEGALWDTADSIYPLIGGRGVRGNLVFHWDKYGTKIDFSYLARDADVYDWQGSQIPLICTEINTKIETKKGFTTTGKLKVGDKVRTLNGWGNVSKVGKPYLTNCVSAKYANGDKQIQSSNHEFLTSKGDWTSYDNLIEIYQSKRCHFSHRFYRYFLQRLQSVWCILSKRLCYLLPFLKSKDSYHRQFSQGNAFCKADINRGNDFLLSAESSARVEMPPLCFRISAMQASQYRSKDNQCHKSLSFLLFYAKKGAQMLLKVLGLKERYSVYFHQCDGHAHLHKGIFSKIFQQLICVVKPSIRCLNLDALNTSGLYSPYCQFEYQHPYERYKILAEEDLLVDSLLLTPVGDRQVIDITVDNYNNYITGKGHINKNCFDELTHFSKKQFFYMLSRNRSVCGVKPYIRATTNPDPDSWVRKFIDWWIDDNGFAIEARSGVVRWFVHKSDEIFWFDRMIDAHKKFPKTPPKSFTFITSNVYDNQILIQQDPDYIANLEALQRVDRERLLNGNWNVRMGAGDYFKRSNFEVVDALPKMKHTVRCWDLASTAPSEINEDPDFTVGMKAGVDHEGVFYVMDIKRDRVNPTGVETLIKNTSSQDGKGVEIRIPQDPGSAGKVVAKAYIKMMAGYTIQALPVSGDKEVRAKPASSQSGINNIRVLRANWNDAFFDELEGFPIGGHDDQVDTLSDCIDELTEWIKPMRVIEKPKIIY